MEVENEFDYRDGVKFAVDCIEEEYEEGDELADLVFETVDSHGLIIFYNNNLKVLQYSENQPEKWQMYVDDDSSWQRVIQAMAFDVFEQDVWEEVRNRGLE